MLLNHFFQFRVFFEITFKITLKIQVNDKLMLCFDLLLADVLPVANVAKICVFFHFLTHHPKIKQIIAKLLQQN